MPTYPVHAYGFSATFKLRELVPLFSSDPSQVRLKERLIAILGEGRWVLAYDFGAVVFVGVDEAEQKRIIEQLSKRLTGEPHPPLTEQFLIDVQPGAVGEASGASRDASLEAVPRGTPGGIEVRFDRVIVPELTTEVIDIVALIVAQSVAMDYYARDVDQIEVETDRIAEYLRSAGRIPGRVKQLIQFIGLCIATRNDVISTLALFDKPDATWENEHLDRLWEGLYRMLELDDRYKALEAKLRMFQDNLVVLVDLARQRHTLQLEMIVILLILGEGLLMLWQILSGVGH
jgi:uncharacterized Rmd1/YagE family protein